MGGIRYGDTMSNIEYWNNSLLPGEQGIIDDMMRKMWSPEDRKHLKCPIAGCGSEFKLPAGAEYSWDVNYARIGAILDHAHRALRYHSRGFKHDGHELLVKACISGNSEYQRRHRGEQRAIREAVHEAHMGHVPSGKRKNVVMYQPYRTK